jgi:SAM-dependent methyltransferase
MAPSQPDKEGDPMNETHLKALASPQWAQILEKNLLPWVTSVADLGDDVLEVGPGPGLSTDLLRRGAARVTAVEIDPVLAGALAERLAGTNVEVINGNAAETGFPGGRFSAAACFSVLHHVPTTDEQDRIFRELLRVLRPGGVLVAVDAYDNARIREAHTDDVFVPLDPETLADRLAAAGFAGVGIERAEHEIRFYAGKPA